MASFSPFTAGQIWTATICNALAGGWISIDGAGIFTFGAADGHTFTMNSPSDCTGFLGVGAKIQLTQASTVKYFIVTAITSSVITLYGGQNYTLTSGAISIVSSSPFKAPVNFPADPSIWTETLKDTANHLQSSPTANTWYNTGSLSLAIPIGSWDVYLQGALGVACLGTGDVDQQCNATLSTANNSVSDADWTPFIRMIATVSVSGDGEVIQTVFRRKQIVIATKTTYFLNVLTPVATGSSLGWFAASGNSPTIIRAVCAYL